MSEKTKISSYDLNEQPEKEQDQEQDQKYIAPPPNSGCQNICELKFGLKDYEDEITEYYKRLVTATKKGLPKSSVQHWREPLKVIDPYANIRIYEDPEIALAGNAHCHLPLWQPSIFETLVLNEVNILGTVLTVLIENASNPNLAAITRKLNNLYRNKFSNDRTSYLKAIIDGPAIRTGLKDQAQHCLDRTEFAETLFCDRGSIIIARWLLEKYYDSPEFWTNKAGELVGAVDKMVIPEEYSVTGSRVVFRSMGIKKISYKSSFSTGIKFKKKDNKEEENE